MIKPYKNREYKNTQLDVYRNLNNGLFSLRDSKSKLVLAHGEDFLFNVDGIFVSKKAQQRVRKDMRRSVHAYFKGNVIDSQEFEVVSKVRYNPYEHDTFILEDGDVCTEGVYYFNEGECYLVELK